MTWIVTYSNGDQVTIECPGSWLQARLAAQIVTGDRKLESIGKVSPAAPELHRRGPTA